MKSFEGAVNAERPRDFRNLIGELVEHSELFPLKRFGEEELTIVDAIERNVLTLYMPERPSNNMLNAARCLTTIHDELENGEPDKELIERTVGELKGYLDEH